MGGVGGGGFNDANKDSINQNFMISSAFCENRFDEKYFREGDGWGGWWCRGQPPNSWSQAFNFEGDLSFLQ